MVIAKRFEASLGNILYELNPIARRIVGKIGSARVPRAPMHGARKLLCRFSRLPTEPVTLKKREMRLLLGVAEDSDDIRKRALAASLVPDDCDKVGVELEADAVEPLLVERAARCLSQLD